MKKPKLPKYRWWVMVPTSSTPRRHAVVGGDRSPVAICGATAIETSYEIRPKNIENHPVCGRCLALIHRSEMMSGVSVPS